MQSYREEGRSEASAEARRGAALAHVICGPNGIRTGWRVLIFLAMVAMLWFGVSGIIRLLFPAQTYESSQNVLSPRALIPFDLLYLFVTVVSAAFMARIERRKFSQYGLPLSSAFRIDFWIGAGIGFASISTILAGIFALHGFRLTGLAIHGSTIASSFASWIVAFVLVGLAEEFAFRGYLQYTLATGIGYWPAAAILSALFALAHARNPGESITGLVMIAAFGLLHCLFLQRTGNLWLAVGFHAGYDWTATFFYGVSAGTYAPYHNLLTSEFKGPNWLTGGSVGPEASVFGPIVLTIVAIVFSRIYVERRRKKDIAVNNLLGEA